MLSEEELRKEAKLRTEAKLGFYVHLAVYSCVNFVLYVVWWLSGGFPWFVFPLLGWGFGLFVHFLWVFGQISVTDRLAKKEYQKLIEQQ